ncbi:MAG: septum formation initiator family protein, partial [Oscillospiraceae bacterium]
GHRQQNHAGWGGSGPHELKAKKHSISNFALKLGLCLVTAYLVFSLVNGQLNIMAKEQELAQINMKISQQQSANLELSRVLESDDDAASMERIAREKLGYVMPDERVYMDISGK